MEFASRISEILGDDSSSKQNESPQVDKISTEHAIQSRPSTASAESNSSRVAYRELSVFDEKKLVLCVVELNARYAVVDITRTNNALGRRQRQHCHMAYRKDLGCHEVMTAWQ